MAFPTSLENSVYKLIGSKLKKVRIEKDLTQDFIAQIIGSSKASVANYEKGDQAIYISDLYKIAFNLGIEIKEFLPTIDEIKKMDPDYKIPAAEDLNKNEKASLGAFIKKIREEVKKGE